MAHHADRLRRRIDSGQTGDKVSYPDPAMAPLGTDEEAGGASSRVPEPADPEATALAEPDAPRPGPHGPAGAGFAIWSGVFVLSLAGALVLMWATFG